MRPTVVVFDVNETLSDLSPLAARFVEVGAPASLASLWFASVLRDGIGLTAAGQNPRFADVAREQLLNMLDTGQLNRPVHEAADHVMEGFIRLELHPDVALGLGRLQEAGLRLVTLSNGAASVAETLLMRAGLRDLFEALLTVEDAGGWKPDPRPYRYAAQACGVPAEQLLMVAVHPWDIDGAARAGLQTAWVDRSEAHYPAVFERPTHTVPSIDRLADVLG
jgi:2-haloacid dehalogenase